VAVVTVAAVASVVVATGGAAATVAVVAKAAAVGAASGVVGKYIADVSYNVTMGQKGLSVFKPVSSFQDYCSSAASSAVTNMIPGGPLKKGLDVCLKPVLNQAFDMITGDRKNFDVAKIVYDSGKRYVTSLLKIPNVDTGCSFIDKVVSNLPCSIYRGLIKGCEQMITMN
jgi:hypothetical protein